MNYCTYSSVTYKRRAGLVSRVARQIYASAAYRFANRFETSMSNRHVKLLWLRETSEGPRHLDVVWRCRTLRCFAHAVYLRVWLCQTSLDVCSIITRAVKELRSLATDTATSMEGWVTMNLNYAHCSSIRMIRETIIMWTVVVRPCASGADYDQTNCTIN